MNTIHLNRPYNDTQFKQLLLTITAKTDTIIIDVKCFALKNIVFVILPINIILLWLLKKTKFDINTSRSDVYKIIIAILVLIMLIIIFFYYRNFKCSRRFWSVKSKVGEILNKSYENLFTNPNIKDISIVLQFPNKEFVDKVKQLNSI